jgi:hypothetical protein
VLATLIPVTIDDLQNRTTDDLTTWPQGYLAQQIADAQAYIDGQQPQVPLRSRNGRLNPTSYVRVVCNMVLRVIRNPTGLQSETDGGYSYSFWHGAATGELLLTPDEIVTLTGKSGPQMRTIGVTLDKGWSG